MQRLKLVLFLAEKCHGCEYIQAKMGNTISKLLECVPNVNFTDIICNNSVEPAALRQAFQAEADGVLILSCCQEDCLEKMLSHQSIRSENSLTEILAQENSQGDSNLSKIGGAKWTSSN
jgi:coenzyme F420-reducing hydrogenase delta subunit